MNNLESEIKYLTKNFGIHPQRESGQNFLIDESVLDSIVESAEIDNKDNILEIGAGFGPLTKKLAEKAKKVWAVELEKRFIPVLQKLAKAYPPIEVVHEDVTKLDVGQLIGDKKYKIVANIPYNITSYVMRKFLEQEPKPDTMTVLIQKEVAERIIAGRGDMSLLSVSVQYFADAKIVKSVPNTCFWPMPKVESAVLKLENIINSSQMEENNRKSGYVFNQKQFFQVVKGGFSAKRKQIHNNLANSFHVDSDKIKAILSKCGISPQVRPQDISVNEWQLLVNELILAKII